MRKKAITKEDKARKPSAAKIPQQVCVERGTMYGSYLDMQKQVAAHWTALLRSHYQQEPLLCNVEVPPHLVGLMMAALKMHRAAAPFGKRDHDSYVDLYNYVRFAEEADPTLPSQTLNDEE